MASESVLSKLVELLVIGLLAGALLGQIVGSFNTMAADTGNFSAAQIVIIGICGTLVVIGFLYMILKATGLKKGK